jgi:hypothetical protein
VKPRKTNDVSEQRRLFVGGAARSAIASERERASTMKKRTCYSDQRNGITLEQVGRDNFIVTYGLQVERGLTYGKAATALGGVIMHALSCDGLVDNRERGER